jgi:FkbM family methyltransferase
MTTWLEDVAAISPLFAAADDQSWGGEAGVLAKLFLQIGFKSKFGVEFGQRSLRGSTIDCIARENGWSALYLDCALSEPVVEEATATGGVLKLVRENISPENICDILSSHSVPDEIDCLVIDVDGLDYWVWKSIGSIFKPRVVVIEFNRNVHFEISATIQNINGWSYTKSKNYGASFLALTTLARELGYRLIHIHGPWNLYFISDHIDFPINLTVSNDLTNDQFLKVTEVEAFYDNLCRGKRPSWMDTAMPDICTYPWQILTKRPPTKQVDVAGVPLFVISDKNDLNWYQQRSVVEEKESLLYQFLGAEGFDALVDIGANVGMVSCFAHRAAPMLRVFAVEADPKLALLLNENFIINGVKGAIIVNAIAGEAERDSFTFSLNPQSTLDNRVSMSGWSSVSVPMIKTGERLLKLNEPLRKPFIKIDTQGFELSVLKGLESFLMNHSDWILKMEFAPNWMISQGTDPLEVLAYLSDRYEYCEYLERIPFGMERMEQLFRQPLKKHDSVNFLKHVKSLNHNGLGWVDLLVRPKQVHKAYASIQAPQL